MNIQFQPDVARPIDRQQVTMPQADGSFQEALAQASSDSSKLGNAAKQFEGLIIGQVMKAARESSDGGWLGTGEDQTGELALEMAEQEFAKALASRGGLGIGKLVTEHLQNHPAKAASSDSQTATPLAASTDSTP